MALDIYGNNTDQTQSNQRAIDTVQSTGAAPGSFEASSAPSPLAIGAPAPSTDLYGNSTVQTQKNQAAIDTVQATGAKPVNPLEGSVGINALGGAIDTVKGAVQYGAGALTAPVGMAGDYLKNGAANALGYSRQNPNEGRDASLSLMQDGRNSLAQAGTELAPVKGAIASATGLVPLAPQAVSPAAAPNPVSKKPATAAAQPPQPAPLVPTTPVPATATTTTGAEPPNPPSAGAATMGGRTISLPSAGTGITDKPSRMLQTGVDAYGNSTANTLQAQAQLAKLQSDNAAQTQAGFSNAAHQAAADAQAAPVPGTDFQSQENARADRFTRFVNESDTARLAHDLGTGGGNAAQNAGKMAALHSMQQRDAAAQAGEVARVAGVQNATTAKANTAVTSKGQQLSYDAMTKGQQLGHDTAVAQILGSPLQQQGQLLDNAIKKGTVDSAKLHAELQAKLAQAGAEGNAAAQATYARLIQQILGKEPALKAFALGGGQVSDGMGGHITQPSGYVALDSSGNVVSQNSGQAAPAPISKLDVDSAIKRGASKADVAKRIVEHGGNPKDFGL